MWGVKARIQISRRKFHTYIHLDYTRVEFYLSLKNKKIKNSVDNGVSNLFFFFLKRNKVFYYGFYYRMPLRYMLVNHFRILKKKNEKTKKQLKIFMTFSISHNFFLNGRLICTLRAYINQTLLLFIVILMKIVWTLISISE